MEYRVCWSASSNISFRGSTDWTEWDGFDDDDIETELNKGGCAREGLQEALEASGFEWWVETRADAS